MRLIGRVAKATGRGLSAIAFVILSGLPDAIGLAGLAALSYGCGLYSRPLAFIVPGSIIVLARLLRMVIRARADSANETERR